MQTFSSYSFIFDEVYVIIPTLLLLLLPGVALIIYRVKQSQKQYKEYQSLVDTLYQPNSTSTKPSGKLQKTAVYEMRFYPRYKDLTHALLTDWIDRDPQLSQIAKATLSELNVPYEVKK